MAEIEGVMQGFPDVNAPIYEWACFYRFKLGLAVIPLKARSKRPALRAWRCYENRPPTEEELKRWFYGRDDLNIAIICGHVSGNLVVIDFDDMSVYPRFFDPEKVEKGTLVVETGSGKRHVYLRSDRPVRSFKIPELSIEVRSDGNYVVARPSIHPCGGRYRFISPPGTGIAIVKDLVSSIWRRAEELGAKRRLSPEELQALLFSLPLAEEASESLALASQAAADFLRAALGDIEDIPRPKGVKLAKKFSLGALSHPLKGKAAGVGASSPSEDDENASRPLEKRRRGWESGKDRAPV